MLKAFLKGQLFRNASALYVAEGMKFLIPLILLPYLTRVLGPSGWGLVAIGTSYSLLLDRLIQYGFGLSGARDVAANREDPEEVGVIAASVLGAKCFFIGLAALVTLGVQLVVPAFRQYPMLAWGGFCAAAANGMNLFWYFQGMDRLTVAAFLDVLGRLVALLAIVLLVKSPEDMTVVLFCRAASVGAAVLVGLVVIYRTVPIRMPKAHEVKHVLQDGFVCFISRVSGAFASSANVFLFSFFADEAVVGLYAAAERICMAAMQATSVLNQAVFPRVVSLAQESFAEYARYWRKVTLLISAAGFAASVAMFVLAPIVPIILGEEYTDTIPLMRLLSLMPLSVALSNCLALLCLIVYKKDREFVEVLLIGAAVNVVFIVLLVPQFRAAGMAAAFVLSSVSMTGASFLFAKHLKICPCACITSNVSMAEEMPTNRGSAE